MSKDKRDPEYPIELESQFIMRLPEEPAKHLRNILRSDSETLKNRLTIQVDNDLRHGEVKLDNWLMHAKIVDLPTIVESLKTIDNKSFYKTADLCQMMICNDELDQRQTEEDLSTKNKKKDHFKVDKKFLWPHGITPPTKNARKRRFRKTLKKKNVEAPEIEKEVKKLLRADNEAESVSWEIIKEEVDPVPATEKNSDSMPNKYNDKKCSSEVVQKSNSSTCPAKPESTSRVLDIFGGAVSDSDLEEDSANIGNVSLEEGSVDDQLSDANSMQGFGDISKGDNVPIEFSSLMFDDLPQGPSKPNKPYTETLKSTVLPCGRLSFGDDADLSRDSKDMIVRIEQARMELEELKMRKQGIQHEMAGMDNFALRKRFQDILHPLNQDIMYKEMEYQGLITLHTSEDI